jgi:hypothetical protein
MDMQSWDEFDVQTMRQAFVDICQGETPWVALGNFTNDFFDEDEREARMALFVEPLDVELATTETHHQWAVFCAASVEYLCSKYDLSIPPWIHDPAYAPLSQPWYHVPAMASEEMQGRMRERLDVESQEASI